MAHQGMRAEEAARAAGVYPYPIVMKLDGIEYRWEASDISTGRNGDPSANTQ